MCEAGTVFECSVGRGSFQAFFGGRDEGDVLVGEGRVFFFGVVDIELVGGEGKVVDVGVEVCGRAFVDFLIVFAEKMGEGFLLFSGVPV